MTHCRTLNVLLADDSGLIRRRLRAMLEAVADIRVVAEAGGVEEAIRLLARHAPDACVLDLQMPGGSGLDVLRWIKRIQPSCLVIMLTSCPAEEYEAACRQCGADHFFDKANEFERVVETLIRHWQR